MGTHHVLSVLKKANLGTFLSSSPGDKLGPVLKSKGSAPTKSLVKGSLSILLVLTQLVCS